MTKSSSSSKSAKSSGSPAKAKGSRSRKTGGGTRSRQKAPANSRWAISLRGLLSGHLWGAILIILSIFTVLALLSPNRGGVTGQWLEILSLLFGIGVYLTPVIFLAAGVYLYLLGSGQRPSVSLTRILGFVLLWAVFLATAHLFTDLRDPLGRSGAGDLGGVMGWMLSQGLVTVLGERFVFLVLIFLALVAVVMILGISLNQLFAVATLIVMTIFDVTTALLQQLQGRSGGNARRSLRQRLLAWRLARQAARQTAAPPENGLEGPITTLPPDPAMTRPLPPTEVLAAPSYRLIGGEETMWRLPHVADILEDAGAGDLTEEDLAERARVIEETLASFGVPVTVIEVNRGPVVTQFGLRPEYVTRKVQGQEKRMKVRVNKIQSLSNDLSLALAAAPIRIEAPVPGRNIVGLEVPNRNIAMVSLRGILESEEFQQLKGPLRIALGQDVSGRSVAASLARMPHLLVAGATGSGKSVCINGIICSLLFQYTPDLLRLVMVDPKRVELAGYNGIPHLVAPVVTDIDKVIGVLYWATKEMDRRYQELSDAGARNVEAHNARLIAEGKRPLPYIVIVIDELADIMMSAPEDVERSLVRIAQMARATGIHLVIATQRPSVDVVTGLIKANFPSRIAFAVTSQIDSRVILDTPGAEQLLGRGDMLFMRPDSAKLARLQGAFVSDAEVNRLVRYWKGLGGATTFDGRSEVDEFVEEGRRGVVSGGASPAQRPLWDDILAQAARDSKRDELFDEAAAVVRESGRASTSLLQRRLRVGYSRAARLIDLLEEEGIIGPDMGGSRGREVFGPETTPDEEEGWEEEEPMG